MPRSRHGAVNHRVIPIAKSGGVTILLLIRCFSLLWYQLPRAYCVLSLDHLIRPRQHVRRDRETDLVRRFEIDSQLELGGPLNGKICGFGVF